MITAKTVLLSLAACAAVGSTRTGPCVRWVFLRRQFFLTLPTDLIEAARMDGCSDWHPGHEDHRLKGVTAGG